MDRVLIISAPDTPDDPPRRLRQHLAAVEAAVKAGVGRIVYTSMLNPEPGSPVPFAVDHYETEQAIEKSGVPFTVLRPCWYTDGVFMWLPQALSSGQWVTAAGDGRTSYVWRDDLAATAAAALLEDTTESRRLDVTGPEALSPADIVVIVNEIFDTPIRLVPLSAAERKEGLKAAGLHEVIAELVTSFDVNALQGRLDVVSDTVRHLTGKEPRSLHEFLVGNRDALIAAAQASSH
ncbi:NAD(P)H-binding protein [Novosphingobium sp. ST904]|uniref:NAD(P)H-binding protein n=1 Tax=Novosphingobium sp. ST904 TaxID=1684385 RepID=UPI0035182FB1